MLKKKMKLLALLGFVYIFHPLIPSSGFEIQQDIPSCTYQQQTIPNYPSLYEVKGRDVPTRAIGFYLNTTNNSDHCIINTTDIISKYAFSQDELTAAFFAFKCTTSLKVEFGETEPLQNSLKNIIGYFQMYGCKLDVYSVNKFSAIVQLRVLTFQGATEFVTDDRMSSFQNYSMSSIMDEAVSLTIDSSPFGNGYEPFVLLEDRKKYPEMKELSLVSLSLSELPREIEDKFPYLESLEMPSNNLVLPPKEFPWNKGWSNLPGNLSRSNWFQNMYSRSRHIDIPSNKYRKLLNLNDNHIRNLSDFQFHGLLHMITLNNNSLQQIGDESFRLVTDLKHIGLANNQLQSLPVGLFKNLTTLQYLDLQGNLLERFPEGIFDDTINLEYLNLASNRISILCSGLFSKLSNLQELILDNNLLTTVDLLSFSQHSVSLKSISLNNNPLEQMPDFIFYIRGVRQIYLQNTTISWNNFSGMLQNLNPTLFMESIVTSASDPQVNILQRPKDMKEIDLTGSEINTLDPGTNLDDKSVVKLLLILMHFHLKLERNPVTCDCHIINLINFVQKYVKNGTLSRNDYFFKEWICAYPNEFVGRKLLDVKEEETYCEVNITLCPLSCICHKRTKSNIIIVDCRNKQFDILPWHLPEEFVLDLWFDNNNITEIESRDYLHRVRVLSLSNNKIRKVNGDAVLQLRNLRNFYLSSNNLIGLPEEMTYLKVVDFTIDDNPFSCDCHSLWLRSWIERNKDIVRDVPGVTCNTQIGTARPLLQVPSSEFVCKEDFDTKKHVLIPATVSSVSIVLVMLLVVVIYIYRLEVKVFLYVYLGVRPLYKEKTLAKKDIDLVIVHSPETQDWVEDIKQSIGNTRPSGLCIVDICKDCVAGYSFQDNIACLVENTRRVMFVLSKDFLDDDKLRVTWNETRNKIPKNGTAFIQFVTDKVCHKDVLDPDMAKIMRHTRCLSTKEKFIKQKIRYLMPVGKCSTKRCPIQNLFDVFTKKYNTMQSANMNRTNIFVTYSEDARPFVVKSLFPYLHNRGYGVYLPDKDFVPGDSKDDNIIKAISLAQHTIFVISEKVFDDEWALFTFREALQKSRRKKDNHLIVALKGDTRNIQDEELSHYLKSHAILRIEDENFFQNLKLSLKLPSVLPTLKTTAKQNGEADDSVCMDSIHVEV